MKPSIVRCWCCRGPIGQCRCQDEDTDTCPGCTHCKEHCKCIQLEVGPDQPTIVNAQGGKQSDSPYRSDLLPPAALLVIARVLKEGADKYGDDNWRAIPRKDHMNHALTHMLTHRAGDQTDHHLAHAACRLLFALETE